MARTNRRMRDVGKAVELTVRTVGKTAEGVGRWVTSCQRQRSGSLLSTRNYTQHCTDV